jgi:signal transduction histidine kinase
VQEALTNCARHSDAGHIDIEVHREDSILVLKVMDNGRGLPDGAAAGLGLRGMEERVRELGGQFLIDSSPGGGATVKAVIPLPQEAPHEQNPRAARR